MRTPIRREFARTAPSTTITTSPHTPAHVPGGACQPCQQCHTTIAWQPATFDHTTVGFPLTNAHADPPRICADCPVDNNYNLTTHARPRSRRSLPAVSAVPHHDRLAAGDVRSQHGGLPADECARRSAANLRG